MVGDVGILGAYFNDDGVNPMHDDFFLPMASETEAILRLAREEARDRERSFAAEKSTLNQEIAALEGRLASSRREEARLEKERQDLQRRAGEARQRGEEARRHLDRAGELRLRPRCPPLRDYHWFRSG